MTLRTNRIELADGSKGVTTDYLVNGSAKAWANFNGATASVYTSLNVSSLTDNGAGDFTMNFISAFSSTRYVGSGCNSDELINDYIIRMPMQPVTATTWRLQTVNAAQSAVSDDTYTCVTYQGVLA